jgi:chemotaxis family two-component system sensor kinase Cph1
MKSETTRETVDLTNCDKEQIHIPGTVQAFGALIAFDESGVITRASENINGLQRMSAAELLGQKIDKLMAKEDFEKLLKTHDGEWQIVTGRLQGGSTVDMLLHGIDSERYIDIIAHDDALTVDSPALLRDFVNKTSKIFTISELVDCLASTVRQVSGIDRVKIYKFDANWNGEVIAEKRDAAMPSYLGLHFPQSDIPKQARELYQRNKVRVIADIEAVNPQIIDAGSRAPIDLSFSFVRSVSEIHLQYLRNMSINASMSLSLFDGERFWGLVACHHRTAMKFSFQQASLFESLVDVASSRITDLNRVAAAEERASRLDDVQNMLLNVTRNGRLEALIDQRPTMQDLISSTGVIIAIDGKLSKRGAVPDDDTVARLVTWLDRGKEDVVAFDDMPHRYANDIASYVCGLLALRLKGKKSSWIMWTRLEAISEVNWAGDPYKPSEDSPFGTRLYPRSSFELWKETSRGHSNPWEAVELSSAKALSDMIGNLIEQNLIAS